MPLIAGRLGFGLCHHFPALGVDFDAVDKSSVVIRRGEAVRIELAQFLAMLRRKRSVDQLQIATSDNHHGIGPDQRKAAAVIGFRHNPLQRQIGKPFPLLQPGANMQADLPPLADFERLIAHFRGGGARRLAA
jgi:hypothetical protein